MYTFFLVVHAIVAAALVGVILMQRSEGGGLAGGGSPAGLMSARGAADFLTRTTTILATLFILLSIGLAALAISSRAPTELDTSLAKKSVTMAPAVPQSNVPMAGVPAVAAPEAIAPVKVQTPSPTTVIKDKKPAEAAKISAKPTSTDTVKPAAAKVEPPKIAEPTPSIPAQADTSAPPQKLPQ